MKLIKCYIENFGIISEKEYSFSEGLNCILSDNGTGKTTLSMFIMTMLYGIGDTRKTALSDNERKKYAPWQGGRFGGSLTFEAAGKIYTVERSFGQKAALDTFRLIYAETGAVSRDFGENLGEELFEIDRDGFLRTVFLSEKPMSAKNENKSISAKLSDLVGVGGDVGEYDAAAELLEDKRRHYYKKGGSGEISEVKAKIAAVEDELYSLDRLRESAVEKKVRLSELVAGINGLEKERNIKEFTLSQLSKNAAKRANAERIKQTEERLKAEETSLRELSSFFKGAVPSYSALDRYKEDYAEGKRLICEGERSSEGEELYRLKSFFSSGITREEIDRAEREAKEKSETERAVSNTTPVGEEKRGGAGLKQILSVLLIAVGAVGAIFFMPLIAISVIGAVLLFIRLPKKERWAESKSDFAALQKRASVLGASLDAFFARFPDIDETDCEAAISKIKEKYILYTHLLEANERTKLLESERVERGKRLLSGAEEFLSGFMTETANPFEEIRTRLTEYDYKERLVRELRQELLALKEKYGDNTAELGAVYDEDENTLIEKIAAIDKRASELKRTQALIFREYGEITARLESEDELRSLLDGHRARLLECEKNLAVIQKTKELLEEACNSMTAKYLGKTKSTFTEIIKSAGGPDGEYAMDVDFTVTKNERGASRSEDSFSRGTRDLYALATRLALVSSLYEKELPFLILDDPLLTLDDKKRERAMNLIKNYAKQRQIIYFTCAKERAF